MADILLNAERIRHLSGSDIGSENESNEITLLSHEIEKFFKELEEIGCLYKDWNFEIGLVDFPSIIDNKEVLLCWRSDEDEIRFYHGLREGYSGRKLIPPEYL